MGTDIPTIDKLIFMIKFNLCVNVLFSFCQTNNTQNSAFLKFKLCFMNDFTYTQTTRKLLWFRIKHFLNQMIYGYHFLDQTVFGSNSFYDQTVFGSDNFWI